MIIVFSCLGTFSRRFSHRSGFFLLYGFSRDHILSSPDFKEQILEALFLSFQQHKVDNLYSVRERSDLDFDCPLLETNRQMLFLPRSDAFSFQLSPALSNQKYLEDQHIKIAVKADDGHESYGKSCYSVVFL